LQQLVADMGEEARQQPRLVTAPFVWNAARADSAAHGGSVRKVLLASLSCPGALLIRDQVFGGGEGSRQPGLGMSTQRQNVPCFRNATMSPFEWSMRGCDHAGPAFWFG
jgi:hypothetical protein